MNMAGVDNVVNTTVSHLGQMDKLTTINDCWRTYHRGITTLLIFSEAEQHEKACNLQLDVARVLAIRS
jgi:hypothetical protein